MKFLPFITCSSVGNFQDFTPLVAPTCCCPCLRKGGQRGRTRVLAEHRGSRVIIRMFEREQHEWRGDKRKKKSREKADI